MSEEPVAGSDLPIANNKMFMNQRGLRAGWRLLIFVALLALPPLLILRALAALGARFGNGPGPASAPGDGFPTPMLIGELIPVFWLLFVSWVMSRIESRPLGSYGLPLQNSSFLKKLVVGYVFWGFLPLSLLLLSMRALHVFYFGGVVLASSQILQWAIAWGLVFLGVGFLEEYLFRGYALYTLADGIGFWPAAVVMAACFAFAHSGNPGENRIGLGLTAVWAVFASVVLFRTGSLWLAVGAHAGWDWGQSFLYGVGDSGLQVPGHLLNPHIQGPEWLSGGTVGPEGSVLALVTMGLMTVAFLSLYPQSSLLQPPDGSSPDQSSL